MTFLSLRSGYTFPDDPTDVDKKWKSRGKHSRAWGQFDLSDTINSLPPQIIPKPKVFSPETIPSLSPMLTSNNPHFHSPYYYYN